MKSLARFQIGTWVKRQDLIGLKVERLRITGSLAMRQVSCGHIVRPHIKESLYGPERTDAQVGHICAKSSPT